MEEKILILDCGSQYTQLIARRVRELNVFCEIYPYNKFKIDENVKGVIISGSPFSVYDKQAPKPDISKIQGKVPLLGICYAAQYFCHIENGGQVNKSDKREYGRAKLIKIDNSNELLQNVPLNTQVWMSHGDSIQKLPENTECIASTEDVLNAAFCFKNESTYGIQFHPEVYHTTHGLQLLKNFVVNICGCKQSWTPASFVKSTIFELKSILKNDEVLLGLSGGVDSSVAAMLIHKAIGKKLTCMFIDNGLLRKNEFSETLERFKHLGLNIKGIDASDLFIERLKGIIEPEKKRKIIGNTFIEVFEREAAVLKNIKWLAQGTIYPDVIESKSLKGPSQTIKSHHNVGGLPDFMKLKVVEPLRMLFKDEVRRVGNQLDLSKEIIGRHPFPGPGLGIRIIGDVTYDKIRILQEVDNIYINALQKYDLYDEVWQAAAILLPVRSVGVMGDERTYEEAIVLRAVSSTDGMTADWVHLPYEFLSKVSNQIINKVKGVNRVVYDISSKPPATIEWE